MEKDKVISAFGNESKSVYKCGFLYIYIYMKKMQTIFCKYLNFKNAHKSTLSRYKAK